jgi:phage gp45-like
MAENGFNDGPGPFRKFRAFIATLDERIGQAFSGQGQPDEPLSVEISRFMQQFGFSSVPPNGTQVACIETDAGPCAVASDYGAGEPDLAAGWSVQYDEDGNYARFQREDGIEIVAADGKITITASTADDIEIVANGGGDVVVENGAGTVYLHSVGALDAARKTDTTGAATTMATWIAAVSATLNSPPPLGGGPGTVVPPTDFGTITGGSSNVKIG